MSTLVKRQLKASVKLTTKANKQYSIEAITSPTTKGGVIPKHIATDVFLDAVHNAMRKYNKPLDKARERWEKDGGASYRKLYAELGKLHASIGKWRVENVCKYCKRNYTFNLLIGDNMHSCGRGRCVNVAMAEML